MKRFASLFFSCLAAAVGASGAPEQLQGVFRLQEAEGAVVLRLPGEGERKPSSGGEPLFIGPLGGVRLEKNASVFLMASNGLALLCRGPGKVAVERFVQEGWEGDPPPYPEMLVEPSSSRLVFSLTEGEVAVDGSLQADNSRLTLETPVGAVDAGRAVWSLSLVVDPRSRINNFIIKVRGGEVRFVDRRGQSFSLYAGQRLAGVGSSVSPAIEIGELKDDEVALFSELAARKASAFEKDLSWAGFLANMAPVSGGDGPEPLPDRGMSGESGARPITIDFVSRVPDRIPFRATVRPPSSSR